MKILVDMKLSPRWVHVLSQHGHTCLHWSQVGDPRATDLVIIEWSRSKGYVILTHDLDFGAILASARASKPNVIQLRTQNPTPDAMEGPLVKALEKFAALLESGALISVDEEKLRARILPLVG